MKKIYKIIMAEEKPYDFPGQNGQNIKGVNVQLSCLTSTTYDDGRVAHKTENVKISKDVFQNWLNENKLTLQSCINAEVELFAYASEKIKATNIKRA